MKFLANYIYCAAVIVLTSAGGSYAQTKKGTAPAKKPVAVAATAAEIAAGKALLQKSDCTTCHRPDVKLIGPAFIEIAKKYPATEANYQLLAGKIINGGSGVWGQIPMSPHPAVSQSDAKKMVKYILSLK